ncbi:unnamed protein product [Coffea canephora]|uniref:PGG domain-containing protein n=1 Tax=Coffea canephora TaxID=49390 RepID=A0A068U3H6_COFCA|nr:unnamed protein product [Coffea canephora]
MASSSTQSAETISSSSVGEKDMNFYLPLYKAAIRGDWDAARKFFDINPEAVTAIIAKNHETALHIAVGRNEAYRFVDELVRLMPPNALSVTNKFNETALHLAARCGNTEAAKLLVNRDPDLPYVWSDTKLLPLHLAALFSHKETLIYLLTVTSNDAEPSPFVGQSGITLLNVVVTSGFYDVALDLLRSYPKLATTISPGGNTPLSIIAGKPSAFPSGTSLSFFQQVIYFCAPEKLEKPFDQNERQDIENQSKKSSNLLLYGCQKFHSKFWEVIRRIVPYVKHIQNIKLMHHQAVELVKCLCMEDVQVDNSISARIFKPAIILGARLGVYEVVAETLKSFPSAIWSLDQDGHDLFQLAVMNRHESIFNILYEKDEHSHLVTQNIDKYKNNILHLAGKLAPPDQLNLVSGAALQMQRELQWYKEVEKFVQPSYKVKENVDGKTPGMVFTEEHKDLISEGQNWLKDTAKSCTFVAVLIATVVCTSAITVPGGSIPDNGHPIFAKNGAFICFAISNALSLFSSSTSVIMFLFILNSRCAEADFLYFLPNKLIIGLVTLFLSLATLMIAFGAAIYIVFARQKSLTIIPLSVLVCFPLTLFMSLQYPVMKDMIKSTYGPSIFGKKSRAQFLQ